MPRRPTDLTPRQSHGQPWPIGAFFLTRTTNEAAERVIQYQGRVLAFDGAAVWAELYSWGFGEANGIQALPFVAADFTFYTSDREMRAAAFEANRYRYHFHGTFEENEVWGEVPAHPWTGALPEGFTPEGKVRKP